MRSFTLSRLGVAAAACASGLVLASPAAAQDLLGCRASAGSFTAGPVHVEPLIANNGLTPCVGAAATSNGQGLSIGGLSIGESGAWTTVNLPEDQPGSGAFASIASGTLSTQYGTISVQGAQAQATATCMNGSLDEASSSTVLSIAVNGHQIVPLGGSVPFTYQIPNASGQPSGATIAINQTTASAGGVLDRQAVVITVPGLGQFVLADAAVSGTAAVCPTGYTPTTENLTVPTIQVCPTGTAFDPFTLVCNTLTAPATAASAPFAGPTGGTVIPLSVALQRYPSNPCVKGSGPNVVIVGTNGNDRINGTRGADRIIALNGNDRVAGQGGSDCVSDGNGNDTIFVGNGNARVYVGNGKDRISSRNGAATIQAGNGKDTVFAGNGNVHVKVGNGTDTISTGNGNVRITVGNGKGDHIHTGNGNSVLTIGTGSSAVSIGSGKTRVTDHGKGKVTVTCGSKQDRAYVLSHAAAFAAKHGCTVTVIKK
jgi:hypothetical protein